MRPFAIATIAASTMPTSTSTARGTITAATTRSSIASGTGFPAGDTISGSDSAVAARRLDPVSMAVAIATSSSGCMPHRITRSKGLHREGHTGSYSLTRDAAVCDVLADVGLGNGIRRGRLRADGGRDGDDFGGDVAGVAVCDVRRARGDGVGAGLGEGDGVDRRGVGWPRSGVRGPGAREGGGAAGVSGRGNRGRDARRLNTR